MALTPFDMEGVNRDLLAAGNPAKPDMQSILRRNARDLVLGNAILVSSVDAKELEFGVHMAYSDTDGNGRTGRQILNLMLMAAGYRPVAIKHDAGRSYGKSLEAWQVDGDPKPFISQLVQCVDQEERAVAEIVGRLRENPFSENAIDGIGLEDGPARGRSL